MPLNSIFIAFIAIITIIRLGLIMSGSMDIRDKVTKTSYWMIGLVCVVIAWISLGKIFGVDTNGFGGKKPNESSNPTTILDDEKTNVNNQSYYGNGYEDDTKDVDIKVNPNK